MGGGQRKLKGEGAVNWSGLEWVGVGVVGGAEIEASVDVRTNCSTTRSKYY